MRKKMMAIIVVMAFLLQVMPVYAGHEERAGARSGFKHDSRTETRDVKSEAPHAQRSEVRHDNVRERHDNVRPQERREIHPVIHTTVRRIDHDDRPVVHHNSNGIRLAETIISGVCEGLGLFYSQGVFYRNTTVGYIVAQPPVGVVVPALPPGYAMMQMNGIWYYYYGSTYYIATPNGFMVTVPPAMPVVTTYTMRYGF